MTGDYSIAELVFFLIPGFFILLILWLLTGIIGERFLNQRFDKDFWRWSIGHELVFVVRCIVLIILVGAGLVISGVDLVSVIGNPTVLALLLGVVLTPFVGLLINGLALRYGRRFDEGDVVELQNQGIRGIVDDFGLMHIKLITLDNEYITLPTWRIRGMDILNYHRNGSARRLSVDVLVTYDSTLSDAKHEIEAAAESVNDVIDPERYPEYLIQEDDDGLEIGDDVEVAVKPKCRIHRFADSGILLRLYYWVAEPAPIVRIKSEILTEIASREGDSFHFAFPHRRVIGSGGDDEVEIEYRSSE